MPLTIESLEVKITHDSANAVKGINALVRALRRLKTAAGMGEDLSTVAKGIRAIARASGALTAGKISKSLDGVKKSADEVKASVEGMSKALSMKEISDNAHKSIKKVADNWDVLLRKSRPGVAEWTARMIQEEQARASKIASSASASNIDWNNRYADPLREGNYTDQAGYWDDWKSHLDSFKSAAQLAKEAKEQAKQQKAEEKAIAEEADRRHRIEDQIVKDYEKQQQEAEKQRQKEEAIAQKEADRDSRNRQKWAVQSQKDAIKKQTQDIKNANAEYSRIVGMFSKFGGIAMRVGSKIMGAIAEPFKKIHDGYKRLVNMVKRMILRRLIMAALRVITDGFKTGIENLYQYSYAMNGLDSSHAYKGLDALATSAMYVKNSVGAAAMPVINMFIPVLQRLASWAAMAANAVNQLVSAFSGGDTYTKAKEYAVDYMDGVKDSANGAGKAAKDLKATLLGFDEINRLDSADKGSGSGGGGGSAKLDYSSMFEPAKIDSAIKDLADQIKKKINEGDWEGIGTLLGSKLNKAIGKIDAKALGKSITTTISNGAKLVAGFLKSSDFKQIGTKIGDFIDGAIDGIDAKAFADTISGVLTGTVDVMLGWIKSAATNGTGSKVATRLYIFLKTALANIKTYLKDTEWDEVGNQLFQILDDFVKDFDYSDIANDFWNTIGHVWVASNTLQASFIAPAVQKWINSIKDEFDSAKSTGGYKDIAWKIIKGVFGVFSPVLAVRGMSRLYSDVVRPFLGGIGESVDGEKGKKKIQEVADKMLTNLFESLTTLIAGYAYLNVDLGFAFIQDMFDLTDQQREDSTKQVMGLIKKILSGAIDLLMGDTYLGKLAKKAIDNFFNPIIGKTNELHNGLSRVIGDMQKVGNSQVVIKSKSQTSANGTGYLNGYYTQMKADGGFVDRTKGDLFIANEAGAELVGTVNGRTAVASNQEITGIADAVYGTGAQEAALLRQQNDLLRQLLQKDMTAVVSTDSIVSGLARKNRRDGVSTVPVSV